MSRLPTTVCGPFVDLADQNNWNRGYEGPVANWENIMAVEQALLQPCRTGNIVVRDALTCTVHMHTVDLEKLAAF